jgi:S-DNA-T family DNA segregation ATPase FtsK/SpoIIIE
MLQRRLRIGYNRAARIMEMMEEKGIVGPENGSSPREILGDLDAWLRARPGQIIFPCP